MRQYVAFLIKLCLSGTLLTTTAWPQTEIDYYRINTVAGGDKSGYGGDHGPGVGAQLADPNGVAVDDAGNLYIVDSGNHRIRRVDSDGIITTIAGTGVRGYSGDGGPGVGAQLADPNGVAVDDAGNLYIADSGNHRIRQVDSRGNITTLVGTGRVGFSGGYSGDDGLAVQAQLDSPFGVAVDDAGNLYIVDSGNHRIRRVDSDGIITTIAGTGAPGYGGDGGRAPLAELDFPRGVAVDDAGNLYIADSGNHRIRRVDGRGNITTLVGTGRGGYSGDDGPAVQAQLDSPRGVGVDSAGNLYIADTSNQRIRRVDSSGTIITIAGTGASGYSGDGGPSVGAQLDSPIGVAVDEAGNLYIADTGNQRIRRVDRSAHITSTIADAPHPANLRDVAVDTTGNLYIADSGNHRIYRVNSSRTSSNSIAGTGSPSYSGDDGPAVDAGLNSPRGVAVDDAGNLYIADTGNHRIRRVDSERDHHHHCGDR